MRLMLGGLSTPHRYNQSYISNCANLFREKALTCLFARRVLVSPNRVRDEAR